MTDIVKVEEPVDPAEAAFARMQGELALLRRAIEAMAAERAGLEMPDYSATLGQIAAGLRTTAKEVGALADSPALQLTPQAFAYQVALAAHGARQADHLALAQAETTLKEATAKLRGWIESARLARLQNWRLIQMSVAGLVGGAILCATVPGVIATLAPRSWGWPERLAAVSPGGDLWESGGRMMAVANKGRWQGIVAADRLARANRAVIERCVAAAGKEGKPVRCTIAVGPYPASPR